MPVSELLGGRVRDRIRLYGSAGMYMAPEGYAAEAAAMPSRDSAPTKCGPALGPEKDLETVGLMREAVGPDIDLMVDAHTWWRMGDSSYTPETVEQLAEGMAEHDIAWLEEPLPPDDHEAYLRLKEKDIVPLASGEHEPDEDALPGPDPDRKRGLRADGCLLPGRLRHGAAALFGDRARGPALRLSIAGDRARGDRRRAAGHLLARYGGRVAGVSLLRDRHAARHVSVPAGRGHSKGTAADRWRRSHRPPRRRAWGYTSTRA